MLILGLDEVRIAEFNGFMSSNLKNINNQSRVLLAGEPFTQNELHQGHAGIYTRTYIHTTDKILTNPQQIFYENMKNGHVFNVDR